MNKENNKIKKDILEKIDKKEVKMKPRWWWMAKEGTKRSVMIIGLLAASIFTGFLSYWWEIKQPRDLGDLSKISWKIGFDGFPVILLVGIITLAGLSLLALGNTGDNYKKGLERIALIISLILIVTSIIFWILIHEFELEVLLHLI